MREDGELFDTDEWVTLGLALAMLIGFVIYEHFWIVDSIKQKIVIEEKYEECLVNNPIESLQNACKEIRDFKLKEAWNDQQGR